MHETLQEFIDSRGLSLRVDREAGVIRGVKILGHASRNGRVYPPATLAAAVGLYEGAKVNVNHPKGDPAAPRDYQDRIGVVRNVIVRASDGLFGDLHFNAKHALAEQLIWDAIHAPRNVGFSHNVQARTARRGEQVIVEAILKVNSVDLVADPATTTGLFEGQAVSGTSAASREDHFHQRRAAEVPDTFCETAGPRVSGLKVSGTFACSPATAHTADSQANVPDTGPAAIVPDTLETLTARQAAEIVALREEIQRLHAADDRRRKRELARRLMAEFGLPDPDSADDRTRPLLGEAFVESLLATADESAMRRLIEERAQLLAAARTWPAAAATAHGKPQARDQQLVESGGMAPSDARAFARCIT